MTEARRAERARRPLDALRTGEGVAPRPAATRWRRQRPRLIAVIAVLALALGVTVYSLLVPDAVDAPLPASFSVTDGSGDQPVIAAEVPEEARSLGPDRLLIPSLGIKAPLASGSIVAVANGRTLEIPRDPAKLTVFDGGAQPCATEGTVLIAGHVAYNGVRGALWPLARIKPDAVVYLTCADGTLTAWRAVSAERTQKSDLPQDIFTNAGPLKAVLVTCGGPVLSDHHYRDNVLVTLEPVEVGP
jgi:hypothetical protein